LGDREVIGGLVAILVTSYAAFFAWVVASINRLDRKTDSLDAKLSAKIESLETKLSAKIDSLDAKFSTEIGSLETKLSAKIDSLDTKFSTEIKSLDSRLGSRIDALGTKIDALTVAVARLEGAVWGRLPVEQTQARG